jgi:hypothetical protein
MISALGSIFLLQINPGPGSEGGSLIPGIPNHYISASYARVVMDLASHVRAVAFIVAAVLLVVSIALNSSGMLVKDLNIKEVLRNAFITVSLLVIWAPSFGILMGFGYQMGELIVAEQEVMKTLENSFRPKADGETPTPGERAGQGPADGGASDVKSGGWLMYLLGGISDLPGGNVILGIGGGIAWVVSKLCAILFMIASFVMPSIWLIFATLLFVFGPLVISLGMIPRIGGKLLGNLFGSVFELSLWQAWFHVCAWLVTASNDLVSNEFHDFFNGAKGAQAVDSAYTSAEAASMGLVFAGMYFATPMVVRYLVPMSQAGSATSAIISKANSVAGMAIGGVGGAAAGIGRYVAGKAGLDGVFGGGRGTASGGSSGSAGGSAGGSRGGYLSMNRIRNSVNPTPERGKKSAGKR